jgi:hypothetical protein
MTAERLAAHPRFEWLPGMLDTIGQRHVRGDMPRDHGRVPDLSDDAPSGRP